MTFTTELWQSIAPIYAAILRHPFLVGLTDGSLARAAVRALDRDLRVRRVRQRRARGPARDRHARAAAHGGRPHAHAPPLRDHEPVRVDVLGHGPPDGSLAGVSGVRITLAFDRER